MCRYKWPPKTCIDMNGLITATKYMICKLSKHKYNLLCWVELWFEVLFDTFEKKSNRPKKKNDGACIITLLFLRHLRHPQTFISNL